MPSHRAKPIPAIAALLAGVFALDLLWASGGSLAYGLVDEPAHLSTCAIALLAVASVAGAPIPPRFIAAALVASVLIDLDHIPQYLGWDVISGGSARPYTHTPLAVAVLVLAGLALKDRRRDLVFGVAFGLGAHLFRDLATGPGIAIAFPQTGAVVKVPYVFYALGLGSLALVAAVGRRSHDAGLPKPTGARKRRLEWGLVAAATAVLLAIASAGTERAAASKVAVGAYVPGIESNPGLADRYAATVGRQPVILHVYRTWSTQPFEFRVLDEIAARGSIPLVTWEPWFDFEHGIPLREIVAGAHDPYIVDAALAAAAWRRPLFVRFAHEMNGDWYPWGRGVNGNTPQAYKAAWRRVVRIFRQNGASNVRWLWTPYVDGGGIPFRRYYPGDRWVDWAGLDGFNWGAPFVSFAKVFHSSYRTMVRMTSKPLMIAETGSVEVGGSKPIWIRRAVRRALPRFKHVRAMLWWNEVHPNGTDWRVDSSTESLASLWQVLQWRRFDSRSSFLLSTPAQLGRR